MISTRIAGLLAGIALAIGLVVGAAGAIVAREAVTPTPAADSRADHMAGMAGMMGGASGMGPGMMGSDTSSMLEWMRQHHGWATP